MTETRSPLDRMEIEAVPNVAAVAQMWFAAYVESLGKLDPSHAVCATETAEVKLECVIGPGGDSATIRLVTLDGQGDELVNLRTVELDLRGALSA